MRRLLAVSCLLAVPISAQAAAGDARGPAGDAIDVRADLQVAAPNPAAVAALRTSLGRDAIVSVDDRNGGLRMVGRLDGFLTPPSTADAADIALGYVRANRAAFGLSEADIDNLVLVRRVTSVGGLQRLFWQQRAVGGVPALDSGLRANVTADGRLVNVAGSPVSGVAAVQPAARLTSSQARVAALRGAGVTAVPSAARAGHDVRSTTSFANGDTAALGILAGEDEAVVWDTTVKADAAHTYRVVVDAATGRTLWRRNLVQSANASVYRNFPGAAQGGTPVPVDLAPWLAPGATTLTGPNVHAFADLNDDDFAAVGEETPISGGNFTYPLTPFGACVFTCTWDPAVSSSFLTNRNQNATQAFYFVNNFHDWLKAAPFGFTAANGNFEADDPVEANTDDGANGPGGLPDSNHVNNANMLTPPDGTQPTMQMYLFRGAFPATNGGDAADIVYHEYTHGLSNRLVVDSLGNSTLNSPQAGAMGEAWSDWYAMDYLADPVACGCETDSAGANLLVGRYVSNGAALIRSQAIDCVVGVADSLCATPGFGVPAGGYTYASFGKINGSPEVHADGEIWAQTLWQLRTAIGAPVARNLITRAMELSPDNPSFLDMRNAILQADVAVNGSVAHAAIWAVFASRGMGYFAGTLGGSDTGPVANFDLPPAAATAKGTLSGSVIDFDTHAPVAGTRIAFAGLDSGFPGNAGATTAATGRYTFPALPIGPYPYLIAGGAGGYERSVVTPFALAAGAPVRDLTTRRGWALASGGGTIQSFTGSDFTSFGCGPAPLIDGSLATGWSTSVGGTVTVKLPVAITVKSFAIDPHAICGDAANSGTGQFAVETSPDNVTFTPAVSGAFVQADGGKLNDVVPGAPIPNVAYVRLRAISNFGGSFYDIAEFSVRGVQPGVATSVITGPATIQLGATTVFTSAASAGVAGSPIAARKWSVAGLPPSAAATFGLKGAKLNQKLTMTLAVTDFAGRTGASSKTVTVVDTLGPVVTFKKVSGKVNRNVTISAKLVDPSGLAKTAAIRFGDGKRATVTIKNGKFSVKHKFKKAKTFTITVTAKDKLKRSSKTTLKVVIKRK